jgi:DNA-binding NarL/FixJ family response regulator
VEAGVIPIRILVAERPTQLRAAVHNAVTGEPDLELVEISGGEIEMLLLVAEAHADLVVVAMTARTLPPLAERLLDENPQLAVLAVDLGRAEGLLHRVWPSTSLIQDLSAEGLTAVLRRAAIGYAR